MGFIMSDKGHCIIKMLTNQAQGLAQGKEDLEFMAQKLIGEYQK